MRRYLRIGLIVVGSVLSAVSVLGLVLDWGSTDAPSVAASPPHAAATATPTTPVESSSAFFASFVKAIHDGDTTWLLARLHPAVIERYGEAQCRTAVASLRDPTFAVSLSSAGTPSDYVYASDGRSTTVPNTATFDSQGTVQGQASTTRQYHFALVDGRYRTFLDCGNPL